MITITVSGPQGSGKTSLLKLLNNTLTRYGDGSLSRCVNEANIEVAIVQIDDPVELAKSLDQLELPRHQRAG